VAVEKQQLFFSLSIVAADIFDEFLKKISDKIREKRRLATYS
jgi:hypothetical protein